MNLHFHRLFNTHTIYIRLDDDKIYKLNPKDLSKEVVNQIPFPSKENPIMVLNKIQFDVAKGYLMNVNNPFRILVSEAEDYRTIGFITDEELGEYKKKMQENYSKYYNKGNDCDICLNQYRCGLDGDALGCKCLDDGSECNFVKHEED